MTLSKRDHERCATLAALLEQPAGISTAERGPMAPTRPKSGSSFSSARSATPRPCSARSGVGRA